MYVVLQLLSSPENINYNRKMNTFHTGKFLFQPPIIKFRNFSQLFIPTPTPTPPIPDSRVGYNLIQSYTLILFLSS